MSDEKKTVMPDYIQAVSQLGAKIKLIEDAEATGDTAAAYGEWRAKSGRTQMPGILKCFGHRPRFSPPGNGVLQHGSFFRRPSLAAIQGDDRQLCLLPKSLSVLTGLSRLLPACSGSHRRKHRLRFWREGWITVA